jgi:RimJ/RimL family protein N-acetyltransferase
MTDSAAVWLARPLITERLELRAFGASDVPFLVELGGDAETWRYLGGVKPVEERRRSVAATFSTPNVFIVTAGATPIGFTTLRPCARDGVPDDVLEVGYVFARTHRGHGYAREAVAATLAWGFAEFPGAPRIVALTQEANQRSCRLLEALGMRLVERFVEWGAPQNMYSLGRAAAESGA